MNLEERIRRRQRREDGPALVREYETLSPAAHVENPVGRGPTIERVLNHFDPIFEGRTPSNLYLHGPAGSGKSAVVTALWRKIDQLPTETQPVVHTSTRVQRRSSPTFVYLDGRRIDSEFAFYHALLTAVESDSVPSSGVRTSTLRDRLRDRWQTADSSVVVAVDHLDDGDGPSTAVLDHFESLPEYVCWLGVGRATPEATAVGDRVGDAIRLDAYHLQQLVDVLSARASAAMSERALGHQQARAIAEWADGDAHHALAALFVAADRADSRERTRLTDEDVRVATERLSTDAAPLARVLELPDNRQVVLRELVDADATARSSVAAAAEAAAASLPGSLSERSIERFIYEMAETGVLERAEAVAGTGHGRRPSRVEARFHVPVFRRLYDLR
ncbi:Cdc6/Cdc18 family protein [Haloarcula nitratireducens]|uniref:AAA family ATPase n=1 Tax=Haloarcula nitratireducens TaxID=2487749 RepID=A0AAW4PEV5_9EURY|nr:AAA family ATPase [Halomicroarcula nitratireducens]MBX0296449.1 AAA family ATPase [Halomicroarcula nitratireducens]